MKKTPIVALCGFLGSGKTTLLRRWKRDEKLKDAAYIVHDLSEIGFDATLLSHDEKEPEAGALHGRVAPLHGRHANQELFPSLANAFEEISQLQPEASTVISESTGAARPWPLIKALTQDKRFYLRHFIVTVDALNLHRDFHDGLVLTGEATTPLDSALDRVANVLAEQIAFANVIILTKVDMVPKQVAEAQVRNLQKIHPKVTIGLSAQAGLLLPQLEKTSAPDMKILGEIAKRFGLTGDTSVAEEVEVSTLKSPRPFHPQRLHEVCQTHLGTGLYRTKGFLWLASRPGHVLIWQQAGSHISLELKAQWRSEVLKNKDGILLPEEIEGLTKLLENTDPIFGDRHNELTLIGLDRDRKAFLSALEKALCTDAEVADWQAGKEFKEPWPTTLKQAD